MTHLDMRRERAAAQLSAAATDAISIALQREAPVPFNSSRSAAFPARPESVGEARRYLAAAMGDSPAAADAIACLSELATNAILHSRSAQPGGCFTLHVHRAPGAWRIGVADSGGPWSDRGDRDDLSNRGLAILAALSARWQIDGDGQVGRLVWFEITEEAGDWTTARRYGLLAPSRLT